MKNILKDSPQTVLSGRLKYTTGDFVSKKDITGKRVLNIGCGYGWFELWSLKQKVGKIVGMEIDIESLQAARTIKDKRVSLEVGSALKLPFKDSSFDTVVSWEVLEHIPAYTESKMFKEVNRVLKDKGSFYLSTPNQNSVACLLDPAWWLIGHRHYRPEDLSQFSQKTNLFLNQIIVRGQWTEILYMLNLYFSKWVLHRRPLFEKSFLNRMNREYQKKTGFTTIFAKFTKQANDR